MLAGLGENRGNIEIPLQVLYRPPHKEIRRPLEYNGLRISSFSDCAVLVVVWSLRLSLYGLIKGPLDKGVDALSPSLCMGLDFVPMDWLHLPPPD